MKRRRNVSSEANITVEGTLLTSGNRQLEWSPSVANPLEGGSSWLLRSMPPRELEATRCADMLPESCEAEKEVNQASNAGWPCTAAIKY